MKKDSDDIMNFYHEGAVEKFKELVKHNSICLFTTGLTEVPLQTRPMGVQKVCDQGNFWFLSPRDSSKNQEIAIDPRVQLFFSNTSDAEFLTVYGTASIVYDREKIEELWTPIAKAWFEDGKNDPNVSVIKVAPEDAYYWDTKNGKMVSLIKILASAITGETLKEGVKGTLKVSPEILEN
jgi:general stress protein 26